jgi:hypothetical protein
MIRTLSVVTVAALALTAGATQAAVMQLDINGIQVSAGGAFDGTDHTGTLTITKATNSTLAEISVNSESQGSSPLGNVIGEIELFDGFVVGGYMNIMDGDNDMYAATIGQGGRVNTQAGRGFRIDGLTFEGFFSYGSVEEDRSGLLFGNVDVTAIFGERATNQTLEGSFLLASFDPDGQGIDTRVDLDVFIVPTPGTVALAGLAGIAVLRRKR